MGDKTLTRSAVTTFVQALNERAVFNDVLEVDVLPEATDIQFMLLQEAASGGGTGMHICAVSASWGVC